MTKPDTPKRSRWMSCCLSVLALLGVLLIGLVLLAVFAWQWQADWRSFATAEHKAWPKSTPLASLITRSTGGAFVTRAGKHGGDGLSSHSERHDCVRVAKASCPDHGVEFTAQDHASCEDAWWACHRGDGDLRHEHYGVTLRWIDESHLEESWTELVGLDAAGHRRWGRKAQVYRVSVVERDSAVAADPCGTTDVRVESVGTK